MRLGEIHASTRNFPCAFIYIAAWHAPSTVLYQLRMIHGGVFVFEGGSQVSVGHACQAAGVHVDCDVERYGSAEPASGAWTTIGPQKALASIPVAQCHAAEQTDGLGPARGPGRATMAPKVLRQRVFVRWTSSIASNDC
jgi:hypothetical protein